MESTGLLVKQGNRYKYTRPNGEEMLEYRKNWSDEMFDKVMLDLASTDLGELAPNDDVPLVDPPEVDPDMVTSGDVDEHDGS